MKQILSKHAKYITNNLISKYLIRNYFFEIEKLIEELEFNSILDIGCGEGMLLLNLSNNIIQKKCCAIDSDENEVRDASKNLPFCEVKVGSAYKVPFENESFELVICTEVLEHLENPEKALEEIYRVTNKYVLLSVPREPIWRLLNIARFTYMKDFGNTPGHLNHWSTNKFKSFIKMKFNFIKISKPIPWNIILAEKRKLI